MSLDLDFYKKTLGNNPKNKVLIQSKIDRADRISNGLANTKITDEERAELRETLGLTDPIYIQFSRFVINASKGNFGISYQLKRPVSELISERLPATIELVLVSALFALVSGTL